MYENSIEKRDNDNIYDELCKWAIGNLESLTITLIGNKINQLLQPIIEQNLGFIQTSHIGK